MRIEDVFGLLDELKSVVAHQALRNPVAPTEYEYGRMVGVYNAFDMLKVKIEDKLRDRESSDADL